MLGLLGQFWRRGVAVSREYDVNVLGFACGELKFPHGFGAQANLLAELAGPQNVDGLIIWSDYLGHCLETEDLRDFVQRYHSLPAVSLGPQEGMPCVLVDNYQGVYEAVSHLIEVHGYERIACIRGPEGNAEAEQRYAGYVDALTNHGLRPSSELVVTGGFSGGLTEASLQTLLDERGVQFEALVTPTDVVAMAAVEFLRDRDMLVPDDVAVVGFDDEAANFTPPITSVRAGWYEATERAIEILLDMLEGRAVPEEVVLPSRLVVRESCGCTPQMVREIVPKSLSNSASDEYLEAWLAENRDDVVAVMVDAFEQAISMEGRLSSERIFVRRDELGGQENHVSVDEIWMSQLLSAFFADLLVPVGSKEEPREFIATLRHFLREQIAQGQMVLAWQDAVVALREKILPELRSIVHIARAERLWQAALLLIGETERRAQSRLQLNAIERAERLRAIGQRLVTAMDFDEMGRMLDDAFATFGIPRAYVALYEDGDDPLRRARLIYHRDLEMDPSVLPESTSLYLTPQLLPTSFWEIERRHELRVEPLYFRENQIGFAMFEGGPLERDLYETLRRHISNAIWKILLVQRIERQALQLRTAAEVAQDASSILDPNELIWRVVELARERFDLYYAGLFLVDDVGEWAVLRAGTGEPGRTMVGQGHRLNVGGSSMIGQCVATGEPQIALDVGKEAVRFDNPLLPRTRSEMALPLISRDRVLGALTIQSAQPAAFQDSDIAVLQTLASQVANAIDNARLFNEAQLALRDLEAAQKRYQQEAWSDYMGKRGTLTYVTQSLDETEASLDREIQRALQRSKTTIVSQAQGAEGAEGGERRNALVTPVKLRGIPIGALGVHDDTGARQWTAEDMALVELIAERMAQVAENLRLLDATQRRAAHERLVSEVTGRVRSSMRLDSVMRTAVQELGAALGTDRAYIVVGGDLSVPEADDGAEGRGFEAGGERDAE
jgi:DNA-binding LacI/PurR family transcriptional regulator/GAF domain-containing protein